MLSSTGAQINLVMEQSGNYSCQAFNSKTLRYTTSQPNITNISVTSSSNLPVEGTSVNLTCDASGSIFTREWMINGIELKPSENIVFSEEKRVLSFRNLARKDTGRYTCRISNSFSSQSVDYTMNVNYGPYDVTITCPAQLEVGQSLALFCSAESVPGATYSWMFNGELRLNNSEVLVIPNLDKSDSGKYKCEASNAVTGRSLSGEHTLSIEAILPFCNKTPKTT
uniref:Ig-like domain-containing protein n=1 Tax=Neogobius melanostomus TaxID=47308 RepID=A0A8C6T9K0_9GOBI